MLFVKQSTGTSDVTWNTVKSANVSFDLPGTAVMYVKFRKIGRLVFVKFECTGTVTNKTPSIPPAQCKIPAGFEPILDMFVSVHQRTAGNNYSTYYGGCMYQLSPDGWIGFNCEDGSALERNGNCCYISKS